MTTSAVLAELLAIMCGKLVRTRQCPTLSWLVLIRTLSRYVQSLDVCLLNCMCTRALHAIKALGIDEEGRQVFGSGYPLPLGLWGCAQARKAQKKARVVNDTGRPPAFQMLLKPEKLDKKTNVVIDTFMHWSQHVSDSVILPMTFSFFVCLWNARVTRKGGRCLS